MPSSLSLKAPRITVRLPIHPQGLHRCQPTALVAKFLSTPCLDHFLSTQYSSEIVAACEILAPDSVTSVQ
jgi:hypothetical protein